MLKDRCDIILPTCGQRGLVRGCIESLIKSTGYPYRLILIDNGAAGETAEYLNTKALAGKIDMELIRPSGNIGWVRAINLGLEHSKDSKYICFQNDDTVFTRGWLEELVGIFEKDAGIGIANPEWEKPVNIPIDDYARSLKACEGKAVDTDWCRGHCFFLRREVTEKIGGLDKVYIPGYYDDRDYSLKAIEAGFRCVRARGAFVYHIRNITIGDTTDRESIKKLQDAHGRIFYERWGYPLKIIFIFKDNPGSKDLLREACMDQNKVTVIIPGNDDITYEHTNMKKVKFSPALFGPLALLHIIFRRSRKRQKGIDFIFTNDEGFFSLARLFSGLLPCGVDMEKDIAGSSDIIMGRIRDKKKAVKGR